MPATTCVVRVWDMVIDPREGREVTSTRTLVDALSLMQPLGAVPTAPAAGANRNAARS
jgi:hypothetical protein